MDDTKLKTLIKRLIDQLELTPAAAAAMLKKITAALGGCKQTPDSN